jgi:hypothetical protein
MEKDGCDSYNILKNMMLPCPTIDTAPFFPQHFNYLNISIQYFESLFYILQARKDFSAVLRFPSLSRALAATLAGESGTFIRRICIRLFWKVY